MAEQKSGGGSEMPEETLVAGIRDYMRASGFERLHLGLSGGVDSALTAYLAGRAAGCEKVTCFGMPSRFSSKESVEDARELAENLRCRFEVLSIEPVFESFLSVLKNIFNGMPFDTAEENVQSRIRGTLLMAYANKFNSMLLATFNKSELATGYCTLYGDMNGAIGPLGDLFKTEVYALCRHINSQAEAEGIKPPIPRAIIDKPPSAELRPNQKDQDSLPPYETLDEILKLYMYENFSRDEIARRGWDAGLAEKIINTVERSRFKSRYAPPVITMKAKL
jgi:NAD+ synthase (glutamine-hydrolysing)